MNVSHEQMLANRYPERLHAMEAFLGHIFGATTLVQYVTDTCQFSDYSKYKMNPSRERKKPPGAKPSFPRTAPMRGSLGPKSPPP